MVTPQASHMPGPGLGPVADTLLDCLDFGVAVYGAVDGGADFVLLYVNRAGARIVRTPRQQAVGARLSELMQRDPRTDVIDALRRVHRSGVPEALPARHHRDDHRDGYFTHEFYGLPTGMIAWLFREVTAEATLRQRVERERERYGLLTSALVEGLWDWEPQSGAIYLSPVWKDQLGYGPEELPDSYQTFAGLLVDDDREAVLGDLERFVQRGGRRWEREFRLRHKDGHVVPVLARGSAVRDADGIATRVLGLHIDLSDARSLEAAQARQTALLRSIFGVLPDLLLLFDRGGSVRQLHTGRPEDLPVPAREVVGAPLERLFPAPIAARFRSGISRALSGDGPQEHSYELFVAGERRWFEARMTAIEEGGLVTCIVRNVSSRMRAREELAARMGDLEVYRQAVASTQDQLAAVDTEHRYLMVNDAYAAFLGQQPQSLIGHRIEEFFSGESLNRNVRPNLARCLAGETVTFQEWRQPAHGEPRFFNVVYSPLRGRGASGVLASAHDITALHRAQERLQTMAHHDPLTGLPNRTLLDIMLQRSIKQCAREQTRLAVMFIDLDRFKQINDSMGHAAGDEVLRQATARLSHALRESDSLARVGGDEFVALLTGVRTPSDLSPLAEKLMATVSRPYALGGGEAKLSCSIGISLYPDDAEDADQLLGFADTAMYEAKAHGRNDWRFYTPAMTDDANAYLALVERLRAALAADRLTLVYHPEFDLESGALTALEALTRWREPGLGDVPPEQFVPIAERAGLIRDLDFQTLERACEQLAVWQREGIAPPCLAVNMSHHTLNHGDTVARIGALLERLGLAPAQLELEVHERGLLEHPKRTGASLAALRALGVGLAIDGFGAGSVALRFLESLNVRALKLDGSYLEHIGGAAEQRMAGAIIAMAKAMGPEVVATRVETAEQADFLRRAGGLHGQGFYLTEPLPAAETGRLLRDAAGGAVRRPA